MAGALLYVPSPSSASLAGAVVAGRSLTVRALVAAYRAGARPIGIPRSLRSARVDRELERNPKMAAAVSWLDPARAAREFGSGPCLLVPAAALVGARELAVLLAAPAPAPGAVLAASAESPAPVLLAPAALVERLWERLARGEPVGAELVRHVGQERPERREGSGPFVAIPSAADLGAAEATLMKSVGSGLDTGVDEFLHRRCSRPLTRIFLLTPITPNQVSFLSLAVGCLAIWCFWRATPVSACWGVLLYAVSVILDHSDGEVARLTFQESPLGAHLDWVIDTIIHSGLVLAMAVTAGGALALRVGLAGAIGVTLSAVFARELPHEIEVARSVGGALKNMGNRDLFYLLMLAFVLFRWVFPPALLPLAVVVAAGSQGYWIACVVRILAARAARARA